MKRETLELPRAPGVIEHPLSQAQLMDIAERCSAFLKTRYGATRVIVFGSAAGQAPWHDGSDLDLAVEGIRPEEYFTAWSQVEKLAPPDLEVDLVRLEKVSPEMRARILEVEMPDDPILALKSLVADELKTLERIASRTKELTTQMHEPPSWIELSAAGHEIHGFYTCVESIFQRIAVQFDGGVPNTPQWHKDLLNKMNQPLEDQRPAVIDNPLWASLDDYLKFRHFFRNAYDAELGWGELQKHVTRMPDTLAMLRAQLDQFFAALPSGEKPDAD